MSTTPTSRLAEVVNRHQDELLDEWVRTQQSSGSRRIDLITDVDLERDSRELLGLLQRALAEGDGSGIDGPRWEPVRDFLSGLSRTRAEIRVLPVGDRDVRVLAQAAPVRAPVERARRRRRGLRSRSSGR